MAAAMRQIGHAILGCGRVAANHVTGFAAVEGCTVRWACDRDRGRAERLAERFAIPRATTSVEDVLADPEVTSVSIATDHAQHAPLAARALAAGKHVLLEKPIALEVADAEGLVRHARERSRLLGVVSQQRYQPVVLAVDRWVQDGLLGRLLLVTASLQSHRPECYYADSYWQGTWRGEGGSALMNQGYHCLDVVRWLCRHLAVRGAAMSRIALTAIETEDSFGGVMTGPDGTVVSFAMTVSASVAWRSRLEVVGERGTVVFDLDHPSMLHSWTGGEELAGQAAGLRRRCRRAQAEDTDHYLVSHRPQIADFCRSLRTGAPMLATADDAVQTLRLIRRLYELAGAAYR
jgi:UDP-N-acetyl-2-amino-2-deoxyglucuronate dehydrogenase